MIPTFRSAGDMEDLPYYYSTIWYSLSSILIDCVLCLFRPSRIELFRWMLVNGVCTSEWDWIVGLVSALAVA